MTDKIDKYLVRGSHIAQILLVALAIFGYFYTVVPVYQKELLSEDISRKEIELRELQSKMDSVAPRIRALEEKEEELTNNLVDLSEKQRMARVRITDLESQRNKLQTLIASEHASAKEAKDVAEKTYKQVYMESFKGAVMVQYLNHRIRLDTDDILKKQKKEDIESFLLSPYEAIITVLEAGDAKFLDSATHVPGSIKSQIHELIGRKLVENKHELQRPASDVSAIISRYNVEMKAASVDETPGDRFNEKQFGITTKYAKSLNDARSREQERTSTFLEQF